MGGQGPTKFLSFPKGLLSVLPKMLHLINPFPTHYHAHLNTILETRIYSQNQHWNLHEFLPYSLSSHKKLASTTGNYNFKRATI